MQLLSCLQAANNQTIIDTGQIINCNIGNNNNNKITFNNDDVDIKIDGYSHFPVQQEFKNIFISSQNVTKNSINLLVHHFQVTYHFAYSAWKLTVFSESVHFPIR